MNSTRWHGIVGASKLSRLGLEVRLWELVSFARTFCVWGLHGWEGNVTRPIRPPNHLVPHIPCQAYHNQWLDPIIGGTDTQGFYVTHGMSASSTYLGLTSPTQTMFQVARRQRKRGIPVKLRSPCVCDGCVCDVCVWV